MLKMSDHVLSIGVADSGRRLFDSLVFMPQGTTYNSYIINGTERTALIDCQDPTKHDEFTDNLRKYCARPIDYIVLLHAEQDHSGTVQSILVMYPNARIICTASVKQLMQVHHNMPGELFTVMESGAVLDLGDMSLTFVPIPFAHWPDNTMVYLMPQRILFSSDLFGAHDTEKDITDAIHPNQERAARSYFSEIMMPFRINIVKHLNTARSLNPLIVAPAHGPVWSNPENIFSLYDDWLSSRVQPMVAIAYVTMHGSTQKAISHLAFYLEKLGVRVSLRNLSENPESLLIETGELIYDLVDAAAVVFAFPTVLGSPHPAIIYAAVTANAMIPKTRAMGMLCSFGWAGKATDVLTSLTPSFNSKRLEPLLFKGLPNDDDLKRIEEYATEIAGIVLSVSQ